MLPPHCLCRASDDFLMIKRIITSLRPRTLKPNQEVALLVLLLIFCSYAYVIATTYCFCATRPLCWFLLVLSRQTNKPMLQPVLIALVTEMLIARLARICTLELCIQLVQYVLLSMIYEMCSRCTWITACVPLVTVIIIIASDVLG